MKNKELLQTLLNEVRAMREELVEIKKAALMTDLDKQNLFWAECLENLKPMKVTTIEIETEAEE